MSARTVRRSSPKPRQRWSKRQIVALGTRCTLAEAGSILAGLSETASRELYHRGEFPVPVLRVGRRLIVPVQPILDLLGLGGDDIRSGAAGLRGSGPDARAGTGTAAGGTAQVPPAIAG